MARMPDARNSRFLAIVLTLITALVAYVAFVHWWFVAPLADISAQMDDLREQQQHFAGVVAQKKRIDARLKEVNEFEQGNQAFLADADANSAFSDLTQRLKQIIGARVKDESKCAIVSNSNFKGGEEELYERVTIQVRMRCSLEPLASILYDLENNNPYLFVDQLMIYRQFGGYVPPGQKQQKQSSALEIRFNLSGYLRKSGKKNA
jgi:general secretion pathway protein M